MPGTSLTSKMAFERRVEASKAFGLINDKNSPIWFRDGHGDFIELLKIAVRQQNPRQDQAPARVLGYDAPSDNVTIAFDHRRDGAN